MLALDRTIGCIEASGPDVLDMYRSAPIMTTLATASEPESCEAYVCAIRKKARVHVYVALVADNQRIFVYTTSGEPDTEREYHHTLQEALSFARSRGFAPERLDLNYSPAMREVVVRNIKILRPPGSRVHDLLKHGMADAPGSDGSTNSGAPKKPAPPGFSDSKDSKNSKDSKDLAPVTPVTPVTSVTAPTTAPSAPSPMEMVMAKTAVLTAAAGSVPPNCAAGVAQLQRGLNFVTEDQSAMGKRATEELASLRGELARALSDGKAAREQLSLARAELLASQSIRLTAETDTVSKLKEELATLSSAKDALSAKLQEVSAQHLAGTAELASRGEDRSRLDSEKEALALRLAAAEAKGADLAVLRRELAALASQRDEASRLKDEEAAEQAKRAEALSRAHQEIANLTAERDAAQQRADQVSAEIGNARAEKEMLRGQVATLSTQREAALLHAGRFELQVSSRAAEAVTLRGELAALGAQRDAALLRAANAEDTTRESSARAAEAETLRGELAALGAQRDTALLRAENLERESSAKAAEAVTLRGELGALGAQRDAALLRAENFERESSAKAAEVETLRGELAALGAQRDAALLRAANAENTARKNSAKAAEAETLPGDPAPLTVQFETFQEREHATKAPEARLQLAKAPAPVAAERSAPTSAGNLVASPVASASPGKPAEEAGWQPDPAPFTPRQAGDESEWSPAATAKLPAGREFSAADDDFFPAAEDADDCPGRFLLKAGLSAIEYASPDQVLQLHQSINLAQISPDGKVPVSCQGYVCCLKTAAGAPQVFAAIFGTQSGQTWVYHPEVQPEDQHGYANALRGAIVFAEEVGFIMEPVQLGADRRQHDETVSRCQVLRRTA